MSAKTSTKAKGPAWPRIADLQKMGLKELRVEYERVFGKPTKSRNRKQLFDQIARRLQEQSKEPARGRRPKSALTTKFQPKRKRPKRASKASEKKEPKKRQTRPIGVRDPRLPKPGTTISKKYKGETINVRVLEKGFEYDSQEFRSLSAVAKHVTGAIWNGFLFFGLTKRETK